MRSVLDVLVILFVVVALGVSIATASPGCAIAGIMVSVFLF